WALEALPALQSLVLGTPTYEEACRQNSPDNLDPDEGYSNLTTGKYQVDNRMVGLTVSWDVGAVGFLDSLEIKSISGYRYTECGFLSDLDARPLPLFESVSLASDKTQLYIQELHFNGSTLYDELHFTTGVFWFRDDTDIYWQGGRSGSWIIPT